MLGFAEVVRLCECRGDLGVPGWLPAEGCSWALNGRGLGRGQGESRDIPGDHSLGQGDSGAFGSPGGDVFLGGRFA